MIKILFVNHKNEKCGVYQHGLHVYETLKTIESFEFIYQECSHYSELAKSIDSLKPDIVLYNYHVETLTFLNKECLQQLSGPLHICLAHELLQNAIDNMDGSFFHYYLFPDPTFKETNPLIYKTNRLLYNYENKFPVPKVPTIGTFGFASTVKGYDDLIRLIEKEFDEAIIKINIAPHSVWDKEGVEARKFATTLEQLVKKPNIKVMISHNFFTQNQLLDFLAQNTINVFMYDPFEPSAMRGGISSGVDQAISVKRPIAITHNPLLRHLFYLSPSAIINYRNKKAYFNLFKLWVKSILKPIQVIIKYRDLSLAKHHLNLLRKNFLLPIKFLTSLSFYRTNSLNQIIKNGCTPLDHIYSEWSPEKFKSNFEGIIADILSKSKSNKEDNQNAAKSPLQSFQKS